MDYRKKFVVEPGAKVRLSKIDPSYNGEHETQDKACFTRTAINPFSSYCRRSMPPAKTASFGMYSAA